MTKSINTLVEDIYSVIEGNGGWDETVSKHFADKVSATVNQRLVPQQGRATLRMSNLGTMCERKLWYSVNRVEESIPLLSSTKFKFLYGDILEDLMISLAEAAGHEVTGFQDEMEILGIKGHRDCVIDGVTVDVKSASSYSFEKFKHHRLRADDPFGYIEQISSYVYAAKDDPLVKDKSNGAFLVVDKVNGNICLDVYDVSDEVAKKKEKVEYLKDMAAKDTPPDRAFEPEPDGKAGNMKLCTYCSYCDFKKICHPEVRCFIVSGKPKYLTEVIKLPWSTKTKSPAPEVEV